MLCIDKNEAPALTTLNLYQYILRVQAQLLGALRFDRGFIWKGRLAGRFNVKVLRERLDGQKTFNPWSTSGTAHGLSLARGTSLEKPKLNCKTIACVPKRHLDPLQLFCAPFSIISRRYYK